MNYHDFTTIVDFLGNNMTEEQAVELMDKAKQHLSQGDIISLGNYSCWEYPGTPLYTLTSEYAGECGIYH
jgi:hypothetical protein